MDTVEPDPLLHLQSSSLQTFLIAHFYQQKLLNMSLKYIYTYLQVTYT